MQKKLFVFFTLFLISSSGWSQFNQNVSDLPNFASLAEKVTPAVVNVSVTKVLKSPAQNEMRRGPFNDPFFDDFFGSPFNPPNRERKVASGGSGFIISADGYILTNHHVIEDASEVVISLQDRREFSAEIIGSDKKSDVALLKVKTNENLPFLNLGDSEKVRVGDWVMAIGSPYRLNATVTAGIVSAKARSVPGQSTSYIPFIQSDVAINPGNSGGPLFNLNGEVIGINAMIYSNRGGYMGISFTIPINYADEIVTQIKENGFVSRGWLGVAVQEVTKDLADSFGLDVPRGALIGSVLKDSPAEKAGLKNGDVIIDFDGQQIIYSGDLPLIVGRIPPEKKVNATIFRDGKKETVSVTTGKLDEKVAQDTTVDKKEETGNILGIAVRDISSLTDAEQKQLGQDKGVVVSGVFSGPASEAGIRRGDIIDKIQFRDVSNIKDYEKISKTLKKGSTIALRIIRDKNGSFLTLKIPK
ncbi:DegQ family serine endoprotease [Gammaproteobacteria bacterium]|nr:DegQ family serine endoprotease [Gammaproteobacteria bacterium]